MAGICSHTFLGERILLAGMTYSLCPKVSQTISQNTVGPLIANAGDDLSFLWVPIVAPLSITVYCLTLKHTHTHTLLLSHVQQPS